MKLFNSKRGAIIEIMLDALYNVVIAAVVIFLFWITLIPGGMPNIEGEFWTKDVALSTTAISGTTSNLFVELINTPAGNIPINITFNFVKRGAVISTLNKKGAIKPIAFPYITKKNLKIEDVVIPVKGGDKSQIKFTKINDNIFIDYKETKRNMNKLECPKINKDEINNILIDYSNNPEDKDITRIIALRLFEELTPQPMITQNKNSPIREPGNVIEDLILSSNVIISIQTGKNDDKTVQNRQYDFIKAYISHTSENKNKSEVLACNILNSLTEKLHVDFEIDGVAIIPIIPGQFPKKDPKNEMLNNNKTAILLEIGNIEKTDNIIKMNSIKIANEIIKTLQ